LDGHVAAKAGIAKWQSLKKIALSLAQDQSNAVSFWMSPVWGIDIARICVDTLDA
jgi:hypothetical protein